MDAAPSTRHVEPRAAVRVWDLPTRLFHWTLAAAVIGSVVTSKIGGNATVWHFRLGYLVLGLLAFRLAWGLVGGRWSRFASFVYAPRAVLRYLRGQPRPDDHFEVGHNPLGSLSVFGLLAVLGLQVASGLVADDEIANTGPLNRFVSSSTASQATGYHENIGQYLLYVLVALHVAAIVYHLKRKRVNLVGPMLHGDKLLPAGVPASADGAAQRLVAVALAVACGLAVRWLVSLGDVTGF